MQIPYAIVCLLPCDVKNTVDRYANDDDAIVRYCDVTGIAATCVHVHDFLVTAIDLTRTSDHSSKQSQSIAWRSLTEHHLTSAIVIILCLDTISQKDKTRYPGGGAHT